MTSPQPRFVGDREIENPVTLKGGGWTLRCARALPSGATAKILVGEGTGRGLPHNAVVKLFTRSPFCSITEAVAASLIHALKPEGKDPPLCAAVAALLVESPDADFDIPVHASLSLDTVALAHDKADTLSIAQPSEFVKRLRAELSDACSLLWPALILPRMSMDLFDFVLGAGGSACGFEGSPAANRRAQPPQVLMQLACDLLSGVAFLNNTCQLLHTDIRPENVLLDTDATTGRPLRFRLSDLGACVTLDKRDRLAALGVANTIGIQTWNIMAPEVCIQNYEGSRASATTDAWSVGVTLSFAALGSDLFPWWGVTCDNDDGTRSRARAVLGNAASQSYLEMHCSKLWPSLMTASESVVRAHVDHLMRGLLILRMERILGSETPRALREAIAVEGGSVYTAAKKTATQALASLGVSPSAYLSASCMRSPALAYGFLDQLWGEHAYNMPLAQTITALLHQDPRARLTTPKALRALTKAR